MGLLRWLFGLGSPAADRPVPERPPDWHLTIDDLWAEVEAGTRKKLADPELTWAREYERSLIPEGVRLPREGDVYEAREDRTVRYLTAWSAPYTGGGEATLRKGERIRVTGPTEANPLGVYAEPVEYEELEARMVPAGDRGSRGYGGFYLYVETTELIEGFDRV